MIEMVLGFGSKVLFWCGGILLLGLAIFVHELGHFLAARWLGFKVEVFSIGFGPAIWKRKFGEVEYKICWIPLGGYVALPQLDPSGMERLQGEGENPKELLPDVAPWKRIIVSVAGPFGNIVLAVLLAYVIYGVSGSDTRIIDNQVGAVKESSEAWQAGLRSGDRILSVNGEKINDWMDLLVENALVGTSGTVMLKLERDGQTHEIEMPMQKDALYGFHHLEGVEPKVLCKVAQVIANYPAALAGIKPGDILHAVDGQTIWDFQQFVSTIQQKGTNTLAISVLRDNETHVLEMTPLYDPSLQRVMVGISCASGYSKPWAQLKGDALMVERILRALVAPKNEGERTAMTKGVGGPFMILDKLQEAVQSGAMVTLGFLRMICINLAILNLLPIPVLDGGHIVFAFYEVVTRRKPHPRVVAVLVNFFAILLIGLMILLVGRDITRKVTEVKFKRELQQQQTEQELSK